MKLETFALLLLILFAAAYAGWYLYDRQPGGLIPTAQTSPREAPAPGAETAARERLPMPPQHPVPPPEPAEQASAAQPVEPPFPTALDESDAYLQQRLPQLIDQPGLLKLLTLEHFIQKLVVIIDQLPEKTLPRLHLPLTPPEPGFQTSGADEQPLIDPRNAQRYRPYVQLAEAIPDQPLLRLYRGLYPLFQQAYRETGNPDGYFNDRLIQVIDHLLETPEPQEPLRLVRHVRSFKFADESLEARSAGQKILLRMGRDNARRIKAKLLSLRQGLVQPG